MSGYEYPSGPQFRADRPTEQRAVRTTIVGGRPPGSGQPIGDIPRGIEILLKKAAVDPAFQELLLRRAGAAESIGLVLEPAEAMMLAAAPAEQLATVIARTTVPLEHRRVFLGHAAAAMLATLALMTSSCGPPPVGGSRPPELPKPPQPPSGPTPGDQPATPKGTQDVPVPGTPETPHRPLLLGGSRPSTLDIKPPAPVQPATPGSAPDESVLPDVPPTPSRVVGGSRPDRPDLKPPAE